MTYRPMTTAAATRRDETDEAFRVAVSLVAAMLPEAEYDSVVGAIEAVVVAAMREGAADGASPERLAYFEPPAE